MSVTVALSLDAKLVLDALKRCAAQDPPRPGGGFWTDDIVFNIRNPETGKWWVFFPSARYYAAMHELYCAGLVTSRMPDAQDEGPNYMLVEKGGIEV